MPDEHSIGIRIEGEQPPITVGAVVNLSGSNDHTNAPCSHFENYNRSMVAARQQPLCLVRSLDIQVVATPAVCQAYALPNKACSMDDEPDRPQDAISENGVARARVSEREPCPRAVELGGYHPRSCLGFSPCHALASRDIERGRWRRFRANAHAPRLRGPVLRSSRLMRYNLPI
jgi:hypothetical protein